MSSVYMATDLKLSNKLWAIKEVSKNATDQAGRPIEQSLAAEADLLSKLSHPMIVDIVDVISYEQYLYVVMDYVEGKALDKVIREEGPQKEDDVQNWMLQVCDALDYLHNQDPPIIYRDMKPSNIMLRPDGYIKLIDLGVAREYKDQGKKDTIAFGTEGYAPPEQYGKAQTDARADIYALGATMWHLLTGEAPSEYPLPDARSRISNIGEGFANVIIPKCTQLDRELRYQNCDELVSDLEVYEELTQEYYNKQKNKVITFTRTAFSGIIMCILSLFLFIGGNVLVTQNYNSQMQIAATTDDPQVAENAYKEAIEYKPGEQKPYKDLLKFYEEKTGKGTKDIPVLTAEKFNTIHELLEKHDKDLKSSGQFAELYYEIGKSIWDYYDDGGNSNDLLIRDSAIAKAEPFFEAARDNTNDSQIKENAEMYINIAEFNEKIRNLTNDNDRATEEDKQIINDYVNSLEKLAQKAQDSSSNKLKLNACAIIQSSLNEYADEFESAGISKDRLEKLADTANNMLSSLKFEGSNIYNEARDACKNSLNIAIAHIERAYSGSVGGK